MAESVSPKPNRPNPPREDKNNMQKPIQVMHISKKQSIDNTNSKNLESENNQKKANEISNQKELPSPTKPNPSYLGLNKNENNFELQEEELSMKDLLQQEGLSNKSQSHFLKISQKGALMILILMKMNS